MFKHVFDEFEYNPEAARSSQDPEPSQEEDEEQTTAFEIPLNTLMDCLNILGTAGVAPNSTSKKKKKADDDSDGGTGARRKDKGKGRADDLAAGNSRLEQWFTPGKGTGMRMSYAGPGHPLTLLVYVNFMSSAMCTHPFAEP